MLNVNSGRVLGISFELAFDLLLRELVPPGFSVICRSADHFVE